MILDEDDKKNTNSFLKLLHEKGSGRYDPTVFLCEEVLFLLLRF